MRRVKVTLIAGLTVVAIVVAIVLSRSPPVVTRSGAPLPTSFVFGRTSVRSRICQAGEVLPRGATAVRVWLEAVIGPHVEVQALSGGRIVARGTRGPGWTAGSVTVPIHPMPRTATPATVCVNVATAREPIGLQGVRTAARVAATDRQGPLAHADKGRSPDYHEGPLPGRVVIESLRPGNASWWSLARTVARRMELGHAGSGPWIPVLAFALMAGVAGLASWLVFREMA